MRYLFSLLLLAFCLPLYATSFTQEEVEQYAPIVNLEREEQFVPSSVEYFLNNMQLIHVDDSYYTTRAQLPTPSYILPFFHGQSSTLASVPIYALIVPKHNIGPNITDIIYFTFYPYNEGKSVCVGAYVDWIGCIGGYVTFGNHVGDWEFMLVRFNEKTPTMVYLTTHADGRRFDWNDPRIKKVDNHPYIYAAKGSHGLYEAAARYTYYYLPNGDTLNDDTGDGGLQWFTTKNVVAIDYQDIGSYALPVEWMNFTGRWGNRKEGCDIIESLSGECVLDDGPRGPVTKAAANTNAGPNDL